MGCNLGKGSQPDDSEVREDGKRVASGATSPQTPPPGALADRMADGHVPNKDCNALMSLDTHTEDRDCEPERETEEKQAEEAATKIQATFRAYKVRKEVRQGNSATGSDVNLADEAEQAAMKEADELADIDLKDPSLNQAASVIQATFRGHRVRKSPLHQPKEKGMDEDQPEDQELDAKKFQDAGEELPDDIKDMDLNDPDLAKAAVKIQATFRGYKTRAKNE